MCETNQYEKLVEELRIPPPSFPCIAKAENDAESDEECEVWQHFLFHCHYVYNSGAGFKNANTIVE